MSVRGYNNLKLQFSGMCMCYLTALLPCGRHVDIWVWGLAGREVCLQQNLHPDFTLLD